MVILNAKKDKVRHKTYRDLLSYAERVVTYAVSAIAELSIFESSDIRDTLAAKGLAHNLERC